MIKAIIIDDESRARNILQILIKKHTPSVSSIYTADSAMEGLKLIDQHEPHLVFLDIEMPFMDGFDLLAEIGQRKFDVIFTTAYDQYAIKAIRFSALDYLLKPISPDELKKAVDRFLEKKNLKNENGKLYKNLLYNMDNLNADTPRLAISTQEGVALLDVKKIIFCEASSNYTIFHLIGNKRFVASKTLKEYDEILADYGFFRVHKSSLVNLSQITSFSHTDGILLSNGDSVQVSRRKKQLLLEKLNNKPR